MCVDLPLDKKTVENQDWATGPRVRRGPWAAGRWAFGPPGRWAVAGHGPRAVDRGPLGRGPAFSKTPVSGLEHFIMVTRMNGGMNSGGPDGIVLYCLLYFPHHKHPI